MSDVWLRKNRNCFKICRLYSSNTAHAECRNKVILATTRATGAISKSYMTNITGKHGIKILQKAAILGTWHVTVQRYWKSTKRLSLKTALHVPRMVTREYLQHSLFQTYNFKYLYWGDKTDNSDNDDDDDDNDNDNNNNLIFCDGKRPSGQKFFMHFDLLSMLRMDGVIPPVPISHVISWHAQGKVSQRLRMVILIVKMK